MKYRQRIYYTETDKALMWNRVKSTRGLGIIEKKHMGRSCASCNSGGVGKWRDYYSQYFLGTGDDVRHVCRTNDIAVNYWTGGSPITSIPTRALAGPESR